MKERSEKEGSAMSFLQRAAYRLRMFMMGRSGMDQLNFALLIGGILLLPLYYVLYRRRKKIIRSFSEQEPGKDPDGNSGGPDGNSGGAEKTDGDQNENEKDA